jgi:uncharacterized protein YbjT (DUF2867 family)
MTSRTATIIGSSGLIGGYLTELLSEDEYFDKVRVISRRPVTLASPKIEIRVIDFEDVQAFRSAIAGSDTVFVAVGTTQKKVHGDQAAYRKVDFDIPVNAAKYCRDTGCRQFLLVSSVGADAKAKNFYLKLKGETEEAVIANNLSTICIFRPSMLLGKRNEKRIGESIGKVFMKGISFLLPRKFRPVHAKSVAMAMLKAAKTAQPGVSIFDTSEIKKNS